ncbi:MAG: transcriptional regulator [Clostridiales bacterium]|jgi:uncharacterized protein YaaQ|nr:transcriptional regulator [Clostridiales bacterium]
MKLILAIVSHDDANGVIRALTHDGFSVTKLATTGGFLMAGNTTIILGVEDNRVDEAIDIIKKKSRSRKQAIPTITEPGLSFRASMPVEVNVGGATLFVLDIDRFEKI